MAIIPAGFAQITLVGGGDALPQGAVTTWGTNLNDLGFDPQVTADALAEEASIFWDATAVSAATLSRLELKVGPTATGPTYESVINSPGNQGANGAPPNVAALVRKTVSGVSARLAGRAYLPAIPEGVISSAGFLDAGTVDQFQTALDAWYEAIDAIAGPPVVFSSTSSDPRECSRFIVQSRVATQRRRLRR